MEVVKIKAYIPKFLNFEKENFIVKAFLKMYTIACLDDGKHLELKLEFLANYTAELSLLNY